MRTKLLRDEQRYGSHRNAVTAPPAIHAVRRSANRPGRASLLIGVFRDLGSIIQEYPDRYRVLGIAAMDTSGISLHVVVHVVEYPRGDSSVAVLDITCVGAVDFAIRPPSPSLMIGGPRME